MTDLNTQNLTVKIGHKTICEKLNLHLQAGQIWGVLGRNGTGKTTLLHTLAGLRSASEGKILLNDLNITEIPRKKIAQKIGLLLQHTEDAFPSSVLETVVSGRHPHIENWQWENKHDFEIAKQALAQVNMQDYAQRQVNELSGGERQRVSIATLLTQSPDIYLLDEPNTHLDLHYQIDILENLSQYTRKHQQIIFMSLHDINLASRFCTHLLFLFDHKKTLSGPTQELLNIENLTELFQHPIEEIKAGNHFFYRPK